MLWCWICCLRSIPAPPGTTEWTRFLCRVCCGRLWRRKAKAWRKRALRGSVAVTANVAETAALADANIKLQSKG